MLKGIVKFILPAGVYRRIAAICYAQEHLGALSAQTEALRQLLQQQKELADSIAREVRQQAEWISSSDKKLQHQAEWNAANDKELQRHADRIESCDRSLRLLRDAIRPELASIVRKVTDTGDKLSLTWDILRYNLLKGKAEALLEFESGLAYTIAAGEVNEWFDNYDAAFCDPTAIAAWIESRKGNYAEGIPAIMDRVTDELPKLSDFYQLLEGDDTSRDLLLRLIAWRLIGFTKIKLLPDAQVRAEQEFYAHLDEIEVAGVPTLRQAQFELKCFDLSRYGFDLRCYAIPLSLIMDFVRRQYENGDVGVRAADVVLDCGACWGDTSLMFAHQCGKTGRVYAFEFVASNLDVFHRNLALNPLFAPRITLVPHAVSDRSGERVSCADKGTSSSISLQQGGAVNTEFPESISIDDFVRSHGLTKVDFIKMDIEGSEMAALAGAAETIRRFRPRLAISVYHKPDDIWQIPLYLKTVNPEYRFSLKHCSRSSLETILFAS